MIHQQVKMPDGGAKMEAVDKHAWLSAAKLPHLSHSQFELLIITCCGVMEYTAEQPQMKCLLHVTLFKPG